MASCPQCGNDVPAKVIWQAYGLSGVVCPQCNASLWPKDWSSFVLILVSWSLGWAARVLLQWKGAGWPLDFLGWAGTFLISYVLLMRPILRLRLKEPPLTTLKP